MIPFSSTVFFVVVVVVVVLFLFYPLRDVEVCCKAAADSVMTFCIRCAVLIVGDICVSISFPLFLGDRARVSSIGS